MTSVARTSLEMTPTALSCELIGFMVEHEVGVSRQQLIDFIETSMQLSFDQAQNFLDDLIAYRLIVPAAQERFVLPSNPFRLTF